MQWLDCLSPPQSDNAAGHTQTTKATLDKRRQGSPAISGIPLRWWSTREGMKVTHQRDDQRRGDAHGGQLRHGVVGRISVENGDPDQAAPADVVASAI